jgi:hypothetical protein
MAGYSIYVIPGTQQWRLTRPDGRRYVGIYNPFTDANLTRVLNNLWNGRITGWIEEELKDDGIIDGEPQMIDADKGSFKIIATVPMERIGKILQKLVSETE